MTRATQRLLLGWPVRQHFHLLFTLFIEQLGGVPICLVVGCLSVTANLQSAIVVHSACPRLASRVDKGSDCVHVPSSCENGTS